VERRGAKQELLYGPIYYRLLLGTGAIDTAFVDQLYGQFLTGHRARRGKKTKAAEGSA
jgi:hypothetical protein